MNAPQSDEMPSLTILNLSPDEASGLSGPEVLKLIVEMTRQEREACAKIAEEMADQHRGYSLPESRGATQSADVIAARIRARK